MFTNLIDGLNNPRGDINTPTPLNTNLNTSAASNSNGDNIYESLLKMKSFRIGGVDVTVAAITNVNIGTLTKLPANLGVYNGAYSAATLTSNLAAKKIVILLSKQSTLAEEMAFINAYGLSSFIDVVVTSNNGEMMYSADGTCISGFDCVADYPLILNNSQDRPYLYAMPPPLGSGIGVLNVTFDADGYLTAFSGESVVFNRTKHLPNVTVEKDLADRALIVTQQNSKVMSSVPISLTGDGNSGGPCRRGQCTFGSLVADAMRNYSGADYAWLGGGSVRANISAGTLLGFFFKTPPILICDFLALNLLLAKKLTDNCSFSVLLQLFRLILLTQMSH